MLLALSVISSQAGELGPTAYKVFDNRGGFIGRLESNDWTLPDPEKFVSSRHASVIYRGGRFYLEDLSTNGTFVNQREQPMPKASPVQLNDGDRIYIGDYEILVQLIDNGTASAEASPAASGGVAGAMAPAAAPGAPGELTLDDIGAGDLGTVDPLAVLGGAPAQSAPSPVPRPTPPPSPPPPQPRAVPPVSSSATLLRPTPVAPPPSPPQADPFASPPAAPVGDSDRTQFRPGRVPPRPAAPSAFAPEPSAFAPEPAPPHAPEPSAFRPEPAPPPAPAAPAFTAEPPRTPAPATPPPAAQTGAPPAGAQDLLTALGLDSSRVDPAVQQQLGTILRVVVQGLIEV
ncbi:MAG TPA: type VI secretion system-associated FHA domain protein TagH, partial [Steroidobacteraceae bacterium]